MLASLTFGAVILFSNEVLAEPLPLQTGLLRVLHHIYTFLLTPLSSALGASSLGGGGATGIWPLLLWILCSIIVGLMIREPSKCAKIVFTSASIIFVFWIFSSYLLFSVWEDFLMWLPEVDKLMSDLLLHRPLDIIFFLTIPPIISAGTSAILLTVSKKHTEIEEEQYQFW